MTAVEVDALAFEKQSVAEMRDGFDPGAGRRVTLNLLMPWAMESPENMSALKADARAGSAEAHEALLKLINIFLGCGKPLPPQLADYQIDDNLARAQPRKRGPKKSSNVVRNVIFVAIVAETANRFGLCPTRGPKAVRSHSAASLLAIALKEELPAQFKSAKATEVAINQVWREFGPVVARWAEASVFWPMLAFSNS